MRKRKVIEVAHELLANSKVPLTFKEMWGKIVELNEVSENEQADVIAYFYTELTFDSRFVNLGDNTWELRSRVRSDQVSIELKDVYSDIDEEEEEEEEDKETLFAAGELTEEEYNEQLKATVSPDFDQPE